MENQKDEMTLIEKLRFIQQNLKAPKSQYNKFGNYSYRNCEDILEAVKPLLEKTKAILNDGPLITLTAVSKALAIVVSLVSKLSIFKL